MLWILSGSYHSGKNTFKNILASQYGFKVIDKYVLQEEDTVYFTIDNNIQRARRDPYLVAAGDPNIKEALTNKKNRSDTCTPDAFIYDKKPTDDSSNYYCILKKDLEPATNDEKLNYLLVCSDPDTIQHIKDHISNSYGGNTCNNIKTVLIYGLHYDAVNKTEEEKKQIEKDTKDKASAFLKHFVTAGFDYVLCNKHYSEPADRENNLIAQWESLTQSLPYHPVRLRINRNNQVESGIFFAKPFPTSDSQTNGVSRATIILNQMQEEIKNAINNSGRTVSSCYNMPNLNYYIGGDCPAKTIQYQNETDLPRQIKDEIKQAKLVIVDVADKIGDNYVHNPNCWWELGYARALNKQVIILFDEGAVNIPFDECSNYVLKYRLDGNKCIICDDKHNGIDIKKVINEHFIQLKFAANSRLWHKALIEASNQT